MITAGELRRIRLAAGLTQRELARRCGGYQYMLSQIETGKRAVPEDFAAYMMMLERGQAGKAPQLGSTRLRVVPAQPHPHRHAPTPQPDGARLCGRCLCLRSKSLPCGCRTVGFAT